MFGLVGECTFNMLLQWLKVPCFHQSPLINWMQVGARVKADFYVPTLGKVELKSCIKADPIISINRDNWTSEAPDLTVVVKLLDYAPDTKSRREYSFNITYCEVVGFWTGSEIKQAVNQSDAIWYLDSADVKHRWGELSGLLANAKVAMENLNQTPPTSNS